jgi:hypothetical protein
MRLLRLHLHFHLHRRPKARRRFPAAAVTVKFTVAAFDVFLWLSAME